MTDWPQVGPVWLPAERGNCRPCVRAGREMSTVPSNVAAVFTNLMSRYCTLCALQRGGCAELDGAVVVHDPESVKRLCT